MDLWKMIRSVKTQYNRNSSYFFLVFQRWTETYVKWSQLGTYLATFHKLGVALWGGPQFTQQARFSQRGVECIDFSPGERYLVTYTPRTDLGQDQKRLVIWDILSGQEKRSFFPDGSSVWPIFRWSHDDKYLARMGEDVLSVYETPVNTFYNNI